MKKMKDYYIEKLRRFQVEGRSVSIPLFSEEKSF